MRFKSISSVLIFLGVAAWILAIPAFVLWLSGDWRWIEGWIFGVWLAVFIGVFFLWLYFKDPALLAERMRRPGTGGESRSDLTVLIAIKTIWLAWMVLPSLNVRFHWAPRLPIWSEVFGGILLVTGSYFMFRAIADNTFASQLVRIQTEREQHVIDTGVYSLVRHPMYLGGILIFVGGPLLLGSALGLLPGVGLILLIIVRIFGEEKLLVHDLEGYRGYAQRVRYRLVPHVW